MRIAFVTAGAAGMYCGSCMRDNALVTALTKLGHDAQLIPTYTPIRTDEIDVSEGQVYYGGINVYLQDKSRLFRLAPRWFDWLLDRPGLIRFASKRSGNLDYADLAGLTVSMLSGRDGRQKKELLRLVAHLRDEVRPDVVILTNALLGGLVPTLAASARVPVFVTLQGDDIFLEALPPTRRAECLELIRKNDAAVTGYLATSRDYADRMAVYLGVDRAKIRVVYPGINPEKFAPAPRPADRPPTVGYFARVCPEKGFHNAVSAFLKLKEWHPTRQARLHAAGWLGDNSRPFFEAQVKRIEAAGYSDSFQYLGSPDHAGKVAFFQGIDLFTLPADYAEPKGLSVLEAWASGVAAVLPAHGSFPELIAATDAGRLYSPGNVTEHARVMAELLADHSERNRLGAAGRDRVLADFSALDMAANTALELTRQGV